MLQTRYILSEIKIWQEYTFFVALGVLSQPLQRMPRIYILCSLLLVLISPVVAQSLTKQADHQFDLLAYAKAADLYEQAIQNVKSLPEAEIRAARAKLAYSYRQIRDTQKAEQHYRDLIAMGELPGEFAQCYLYYAQALASNGKYREAQEAYDKYNSVQKDDQRGPLFSKLYRDVSTLSRNAASYKVDFLNINSTKAEFSPTYYRNGLVFVSAQGGEGNGIKRVFNWDNSPFLDLFYMPDRKAIKGGKAATMGGSPSKKSVAYAKAGRALGKDDYTAPTSNDSRTVGYFGGNNLTDGLGYEDLPVTESERFSHSLNTKYHEGPATFTKDGSRVIFTRNNFNNGKYRESSDGINKLKLYTAAQTNGEWQAVEELPFNSNEFSTGHPAFGPEDHFLYFSSDMPGGFGGTDIYAVRYDNGKWGTPVNLGKEVNTKGNEMFPFVDEKGNLYFSSDGHPGLGDLDIFFAQLETDGTHAKMVQNLGEPLNSNKDDFGLITDGERRTGYFSSNRKNGSIDDDIYRFTREGPLYPCRELTVVVFDAQTKTALPNAALNIANNANESDKRELKTDSEGNIRLCLDAENDFKLLALYEGYLENQVGFSTKGLTDDMPSRLEIPLEKPKVVETVSGVDVTNSKLRGRVTTQKTKEPITGVKVVLTNLCDQSQQETITGEDGVYEFSIKPGCDYSLEAMKDSMGTIGTKVTKEGVGSTDLTMFKKGDVIRVDNIYYNLNKATIRADAASELDKLVELMKKYPKMKIEMRSHTDSRATAQYNKMLSSNRAKAAVTYLKSKGIKATRLVAKGYGESELLNECKDGVNCTEEEHQLNRRTEIKILTLE